MKGDNYRLIASYAINDKRNACAQKALQAYTDGLELAKKFLFHKAHPLLLGILTNCSVLHFDVLKIQRSHAKWQKMHSMSQLQILTRLMKKIKTLFIR